MARPLDSTPAADGFRMPAEWQPHTHTWMSWPERPDSWREGARPAQAAFAEVAVAIASAEPVRIAASAAQLDAARAALDPAVEVVELATDDAWMRDIGPTFVVDDRGRRRGVDWEFNAWGGHVVALAWTDERDDPQHRRSLDARRRLDRAIDAHGRSLDVRLVPLPGPLTMTPREAEGVVAGPGTKARRAGDRLAASYVNWYVANGLVVVPLLDERWDDEALELVGEVYPERRVIGVAAREILLGGGNVHCITQQVPAPQA